MKNQIMCVYTLLALGLFAGAEEAATSADAKAQRTKLRLEQNTAKYRGNADMLVLPGLVADRKAKIVTLDAETAVVGKYDELVEFFLIPETSGHGYESLAVCFAKPSDIHKALVFIGMSRGTPVKSSEMRFWPKGERVIMHFSCPEAGFKPVRAEGMIKDTRTGRTLEETGLVFVGSAGDPDKSYAADEVEPNSVAANYNEPVTVLDVPRKAGKDATYGSLTINSKIPLPTNCVLQVTLEPEFKDGRKRVMDLAVTFSPGKDGQGAGAVVCAAKDSEGKSVGGDGSLKGLVEAFKELVKSGRDPFVTLQFDSGMRMSSIRDTCAVLDSIEGEKGIRIDAPLKDTLYYRAFMPPERFRDRKTRYAQPWELHLVLKDGKLAASLTKIEEIWKDELPDPELKVTDIPVSDPGIMKKAIEAHVTGLAVILVFADPAVLYGDMMSYIAPMISTHPVIHVFLNQPAGK